MTKYDYILAIDPDTDKSGVAFLTISEKKVNEIFTAAFPQLLGYFQRIDLEYPKVIVIVEAGWLNESNWHVNKFDTKSSAAAKGNAVGRNHETGRKIIEMAKHYGMTVEAVKPLRKFWKGPDNKITHEQLAYFVPGIPGRTNQEMRDAALLCWDYAGLPIKMKVCSGTSQSKPGNSRTRSLTKP